MTVIVPPDLSRACSRLLIILVACLTAAHTRFATAQEKSANDYRIYALACSRDDAHALMFIHRAFLQIDPAGIERNLIEFAIPGGGQGDVTCLRSDQPMSAASAAQMATGVEQPLLIAVVPGYVSRSTGVPGMQVNSIWDLVVDRELPPLESTYDGGINVREGPPPPDIVFNAAYVAETWSPIGFLFQTGALTCDETFGSYQAGTALWVSTQTCSVEWPTASDAELKLRAQSIETMNLCWAPESATQSQVPAFYCHGALIPALRSQIAREFAAWLMAR